MNIPELKPGLSHELVETVTHELTIQSYDPKLPAVLATPAMIRAMEVAAARPARDRAVPQGGITEVDGRFLTFAVEARDEKELIGRGTVGRAIVEQDRFEAKVRAKTPRPEV